jgi:hypothetical protein
VQTTLYAIAFPPTKFSRSWSIISRYFPTRELAEAQISIDKAINGEPYAGVIAEIHIPVSGEVAA